MEKISLLDCTLRDGGYVNNWQFGENAIKDIISSLEQTNTEIIELGFFKNEPYSRERTVFNALSQTAALIPQKKKNILYAAMIEVVNPLPAEMLADRNDSGVDIIRVIVWKTRRDENGQTVDGLRDGFEYCRAIAEKGYKLCVQPARVSQYTEEEFTQMCKQFGELSPMAVYVVDSWGTENESSIMNYARLADRSLPKGTAIGYHGHNNLMQAFGTASRFLELETDRELIIDASVYGIGRGAGNLNLELIAKYLNEEKGKKYNTAPMLNIYEKYIKDIYDRQPWGYSIPYYLTAKHGCNPNYARFYSDECGLGAESIGMLLTAITEEDKVMFSAKNALKYAEKLGVKI